MSGDLDCFEKIATLIDAGGEDIVDEAAMLLAQFKDRSRKVSEALDDFLLDLMTLGFLTENKGGAQYVAAQRLAHKRLLKLKILLA